MAVTAAPALMQGKRFYIPVNTVDNMVYISW
jgi:hypothetical protein